MDGSNRGDLPLLAVDLDEVLGYFVRALADWHNEKFATSLTEGDFHSYRFVDVWGGSEEQSVDKVHAFFESEHFHKRIEPVPGAYDALRELHKRFRLAIVTSRQHSIEQETRQWIAQHYQGLFDEIYFGNHWGVTGEKKSKPDICTEIGACALIDDALHYAEQCSACLPHVILFGEYAWNRADTLPDRVVRAADWEHVQAIAAQFELGTSSPSA